MGVSDLVAPTGDVAWGSHKLTGLANGSAGTDAAAFGQIPVAGITGGTYAAGNDSRITGAEQTANKGAASGYAPLNASSQVPIANLPTGATSSTVAIGNDGRFAGSAAGTAGAALSATDPTTTNSRVPTTHASTHGTAGSDPVTITEAQVTGLGTDLAAKAPLASPTFTGTTTAPEFSVSGLTGATSASRYVGGTTSGAPVSGTFAKGDFVIDQTGTVWICITAGTPGTWLPGGSGVELAEAELSADFTTAASTTVADITGLTITFTAPSRAFMLELLIPITTMASASQTINYLITDSANTILCASYVGGCAGGVAGPPCFIRSRLPRTGPIAYAITPGNSYTFKARYQLSTAAAAVVSTFFSTGDTRPMLRAVTC